jgi:hypothetical protein
MHVFVCVHVCVYMYVWMWNMDIWGVEGVEAEAELLSTIGIYVYICIDVFIYASNIWSILYSLFVSDHMHIHMYIYKIWGVKEVKAEAKLLSAIGIYVYIHIDIFIYASNIRSILYSLNVSDHMHVYIYIIWGVKGVEAEAELLSTMSGDVYLYACIYIYIYICIFMPRPSYYPL